MEDSASDVESVEISPPRMHAPTVVVANEIVPSDETMGEAEDKSEMVSADEAKDIFSKNNPCNHWMVVHQKLRNFRIISRGVRWWP